MPRSGVLQGCHPILVAALPPWWILPGSACRYLSYAAVATSSCFARRRLCCRPLLRASVVWESAHSCTILIALAALTFASCTCRHEILGRETKRVRHPAAS